MKGRYGSMERKSVKRLLGVLVTLFLVAGLVVGCTGVQSLNRVSKSRRRLDL